MKSSSRASSPHPVLQAVAPGGPAHAIKLASNQTIPPQSVTGWPPCTDVAGERVFLGLVPFEGGLHPCKVVEGFIPPVRWSYGGKEYLWDKDYFLVPFDGSRMEWVSASHGVTPVGRRLVEGGVEPAGERLYHAIGMVDGHRVPGKAAAHLNGALFPYAGEEMLVEYYEVL
ncbi:hypothetical protein EXIGLDRAFT_610185 [Exidia glandulosa HHB12029]|uniref:Uncharacterized protein n=1 Tax=Exidia glandulosa HHB12029 TaxID=1314781 RepID=A0A165K2U7_EXIGL|nr:hypothetical protein EXIGLDRAFT_610185 [Exidia glandulosa HHB12029]